MAEDKVPAVVVVDQPRSCLSARALAEVMTEVVEGIEVVGEIEVAEVEAVIKGPESTLQEGRSLPQVRRLRKPRIL